MTNITLDIFHVWSVKIWYNCFLTYEIIDGFIIAIWVLTTLDWPNNANKLSSTVSFWVVFLISKFYKCWLIILPWLLLRPKLKLIQNKTVGVPKWSVLFSFSIIGRRCALVWCGIFKSPPTRSHYTICVYF